MKSVFALDHLHTLPDGEEDWKRIGIYRSRNDALSAIDRVKLLPGFCDYPNVIDHSDSQSINGFNIDEYELNEDNWIEGFVTV